MADALAQASEARQRAYDGRFKGLVAKTALAFPVKGCTMILMMPLDGESLNSPSNAQSLRRLSGFGTTFARILIPSCLGCRLPRVARLDY